MPRPHKVVILALPSMYLLDLAAPVQIFGHLGGDRYTFEVAGTRSGGIPTSTGNAVVAKRGLEPLLEADTIIIPGFSQWGTRSFPAAARMLAEAHARRTRIISLGTGVFVLAEAGLLDGRRAAAHRMAASSLRRRFPKVRVDQHALYVDEGSVLTSSGVAAGIKLCLHVARRDYGAAFASDVARRSAIVPHRADDQMQFIRSALLMTVKASPARTIESAQIWALQNISTPISVQALAQHAGMTRRTFNRRFLAETGKTPAQWLGEHRLQMAQDLLETTREPVEHIATLSGFPSCASMRALFRRKLQMTPTTYRKAFEA
ncbi:GlxA family transcriptional regulator [Streptomyces sp. NPDC059215]|uniref:GlxA family transcriptional regulator n=1 Tax=Streptomyces sp. NPDC059215 TaxID=3346772 RepID=UPI0036898A2C